LSRSERKPDSRDVFKEIGIHPVAMDRWREVTRRECAKQPDPQEAFLGLPLETAHELPDGDLLLFQQTQWGSTFSMVVKPGEWMFYRGRRH
jgi:hypothetical protein